MTCWGLVPSMAATFAARSLTSTGALLAAAAPVAGVDGEEGRALGVAHEQDPVGPEAERPGRLDLGIALLQARGRVAGPGRRRRGDDHARRDQGGSAGPVPWHPGVSLVVNRVDRSQSLPRIDVAALCSRRARNPTEMPESSRTCRGPSPCEGGCSRPQSSATFARGSLLAHASADRACLPHFRGILLRPNSPSLGTNWFQVSTVRQAESCRIATRQRAVHRQHGDRPVLRVPAEAAASDSAPCGASLPPPGPRPRSAPRTAPAHAGRSGPCCSRAGLVVAWQIDSDHAARRAGSLLRAWGRRSASSPPR